MGDTVAVASTRYGKITIEYYTAVRNYIAGSPPPKYKNSGWKRCQNTSTNSGDENYLKTFISFLSDVCTICAVNPQEAQQRLTQKKIDGPSGTRLDDIDFNGTYLIID